MSTDALNDDQADWIIEQHNMYLYMLSDVYVFLGEKTSMEYNIWRHE